MPTLPPGSRAIHRSASPRWWITGAVGLSVALRLRFLFTPISVDEGGYLAVARSWAHGATLYGQAWVDRPQGLLVVYRAWDRVSGGNVASLRILAMIFGAVAVIACASVAAQLAGRRAGCMAAVLVAVTSTAPVIEGHTANGELLSAPLAALAVAVGCRWIVGGRGSGVLCASGVISGVALSIKQSGFDGALAVGAWVVLAGLLGWRSRRDALRGLVALVGGVATVITVLVVHGALIDWSDWWGALVGYRAEQRSALTGADWPRLWTTARVAAPVLGPVALGGLIATAAIVRSARRDARARAALLLPLWLLGSIGSFLSGGQFHRHYWVLLTPALCTLAAVLVDRASAGVRRAVLVAIVVPALISTTVVTVLPRDEIPVRASADARLVPSERVATWFREHRQPGDSIYVLCASASVYALAHADPPYPYLWFDGVVQKPGALDALRALLDSPDGPRFVAAFQRPATCGVDAGRFAARYASLTTVDGIGIFERRSAGEAG